jgi:cytochrome c553
MPSITMPPRPSVLSFRALSTRSVLCAATLLALLAPAAAPAQPVDMEKRVAPCMACHGEQGRATRDGYYPRIAGKPAGYLYNQLVNFRDGRREQYPLMIYTVLHLSDDYLLQMARFFAEQDLPYPAPQAPAVSAATLERGRTLALRGDPGRRIPACAACHGERLTGVAPAVPGVLGLPRDYINAQFGAWRNGTRRAHAPDCMAQIAHEMSVEDISAASAWLAAQPVPADAKPATAFAGPLPLPCGSAGDAGSGAGTNAQRGTQ